MLCCPDGEESVRSRSGTPDILAVNAIVPFANAAIGRPEGANVTDNVSMMSTYNSLDVWRTFALRHGSAGVLEAEAPRDDIPGMAVEELPEELDVKPGFLRHSTSVKNIYNGGQYPENKDKPGYINPSQQFPNPTFYLHQIS